MNSGRELLFNSFVGGSMDPGLRQRGGGDRRSPECRPRSL